MMATQMKLHGHGSKRAQLRWTPRMRLTLHLMSTDFNLNARSMKAIQVFSEIFREHIQACGLTAPPGQSLVVQYRERTYPARTHIWNEILHPPNTPQEAACRREVRQCIADAILKVEHGGNYRVTARGAGAEEDENLESTSLLQTPHLLERQASPSTPPPAPRKRGRPRKLAAVVIPTRELAKTIPQRSHPQALPETPKTKPFHRRYGPPLNFTDKQLSRIPKEYVPVQSMQAQPPKVLFRFWSMDKTHTSKLDSVDGFIAGRYIDANVVWSQPPNISALDPSDVYNHIEGRPMASPFVSLSSCLIWTLRNAIKEATRKGRHINITLVAGSSLDARGVYYARPLIASLKPFFPFTAGKWLYWGSSEWFCWHQVPKEACIGTFSLDNLISMCNSAAGIAQVIRLPLLGRASDTKLRDELKDGNVQLSEIVAASIADIVQYMGITPQSSVEEIAYLCAEIISGWCLSIKYNDEPTWRRYALVFSHAFCLGSIQPIETRDQEKLKMGFLLGVCLGLKDFADKNLVMQPLNQKKLHAKALSVGLENPANILCNELDGAKIQLKIQQRRYDNRFQVAPSQLLLQDGVEVDEEAEDQEEDNMSLFEFGEDGMIL